MDIYQYLAVQCCNVCRGFDDLFVKLQSFTLYIFSFGKLDFVVASTENCPNNALRNSEDSGVQYEGGDGVDVDKYKYTPMGLAMKSFRGSPSIKGSHLVSFRQNKGFSSCLRWLMQFYSTRDRMS